MRNFINMITESYLQYSPLLSDSREIAEYIASVASGYTDVEMVEEHFQGCHAVLRRIPIEDIAEGNPAGNERNTRKEKKYAKMDPATIPPLVIENGTVVDGNHRLRVARAGGIEQLWCYVIED